jgi:hypothetical protein
MITPGDEEHILSKAYVPEHIVSLMVIISKGEPYLVRDYLCYAKDNWAIIVGYPLEGVFSPEVFILTVREVVSRFKPEYLWMVAPEIPEYFLKSVRKVEYDEYYKVELDGFAIKSRLMREVNRALKDLTVERANNITKEHRRLIDEFLRREKPNDLVRELYLSMPEYVSRSNTALVLNASDARGRLSAFYVLENAARRFVTYLVGCHSKKHYTPHASDLLFFEMVKVAQEYKKQFINLGLGVNGGIKRFKEKWGGVPFLRYAFCEYDTGYTRPVTLIKLLESKL